MSSSQTDDATRTKLPREVADWLRSPFARFLRLESAAGAVLLVCTVVAIAFANSPLAEAFSGLWETPLGLTLGALEFSRSAKEWINDGLMTLFFFVVALELKRQLVLGELGNPRVAAFSISAAAGGMVVPALFYVVLQAAEPAQHAWGVVMATDTAFVLGCLGLLGSRIPTSLRVFMLSLAIFDDIGAVLVVAIGYGESISWVALGLGVLGLGVVYLLARLGARAFPLYILVGSSVWIAVDASGVHATATGVVLGLMTPARRWVSDERLYAILDQVIAHPEADEGSHATADRQTLQMAEIAARETLSPLERLEIGLHPWVVFLVMPLFALANAGFPLSLSGVDLSLATAVFVGFALGKPCGVLAFAWLAVRLRLAVRPPDLSWRSIAGGAVLAGIGFTMALFIANLALSPAELDSAKLGILVSSVVSACAGLVLLRVGSPPASPAEHVGPGEGG